MLAAAMYLQRGTPFIYQGEEIGMTNYPFADASQLRDIESLNLLKEAKTDEQTAWAWNGIRHKGRDNARTPMQWDDSANAGFTTGIPWIRVNPNFQEINAQRQVGDPESVFSYYKELIRLRHENAIIVYGDYELLEPEHEDLFIYQRHLEDENLTVICNFADHEVTIPETVQKHISKDSTILIGNYKQHTTGKMKPYEAIVWQNKEN